MKSLEPRTVQFLPPQPFDRCPRSQRPSLGDVDDCRGCKKLRPFFQNLGRSMAYSTETDLDQIWGANRVTMVAADDGLSVRNHQRINSAIADADAMINSYIAKRYPMPLNASPDGFAILRKISADLAIYALATSADRMIELIQKRHETAMGFLRDVAAGKAEIGTLTADFAGGVGPETVTANEAVLVGNERMFSRQSLRGM